jgi:hypothetical protein
MKRNSRSILRLSYLLLLLVVFAALEPAFRAFDSDEQVTVVESSDQEENSGEEQDHEETENLNADAILPSPFAFLYTLSFAQGEHGESAKHFAVHGGIESPPELM